MSEVGSNTYIGLTIGPIIKTISNARETGELWGSSYIFSYVIKNIIHKLIREKNGNEYRDTEIRKRFIIPYVQNDKLFETLENSNGEGNKVGIFHDRFIFKSIEGDFEKVSKAAKEVKQELTEKLFNNLYEDKEDRIKFINEKVKINKFVEDFLKIYFVEVEIDNSDMEDIKEKNSISDIVNNYLDVLELREKYINKQEVNYLEKILCNSKIKNGFLTMDSQGENYNKFISGKSPYPSVTRIALKEFDSDLPKEDDTELIIEYIASDKFGEEKRRKLKKYHEYLAVVQIDGDSMGKAIKSFKADDDYRKFSNSLLEYSERSYEIITAYGGFTIYAGGDDLLFLAPIINCNSQNESKNIFQLFDELSEEFNLRFKEYHKDGIHPTISIGAAIINNKFPLYFALDEARTLLFNDAKSFKNKNEEKNAIAFKVIKNSGDSFKSILGKDSESYKKFKEMFNDMIKEMNDDYTKRYLNQIHVKIAKDEFIINKIGGDKTKLENYFKNNFNETIHKEECIGSFLRKICDFIHCIYVEHKSQNDYKCINAIYACLKFIRFINEKSSLSNASLQKEGELNG